jgi:hypothetical protein
VSLLVGGAYREVIESATFTTALGELGDIRRLDEVLTGVYWALSTNPEVYEVVKGFQDIRLLKTDPLGGLPGFRIWFRIDENGQHVHLEHIEPIAEA